MNYPKVPVSSPLYNYFLNRILSTGLYTTNTTLSNQAKLISKAATLQVKAYNAHRGYSFVPAEVIVDGNTPFRMDSIIYCFPDIFSLNANHISKKACKRYNIQFNPELELIAIQDSQEAIKVKLEAKNTTINNQLTKDIQVKPFPLKEENIFTYVSLTTGFSFLNFLNNENVIDAIMIQRDLENNKLVIKFLILMIIITSICILIIKYLCISNNICY